MGGVVQVTIGDSASSLLLCHHDHTCNPWGLRMSLLLLCNLASPLTMDKFFANQFHSTPFLPFTSVNFAA
jgi:hypothetical protein